MVRQSHGCLHSLVHYLPDFDMTLPEVESLLTVVDRRGIIPAHKRKATRFTFMVDGDNQAEPS